MNKQTSNLKISIRFFSTEISSEKITALLKIPPTSFHENGDSFYNSAGNKLGNRKQAGWLYSKEYINFNNLDNSINDCLSPFLEKEKELSSLKGFCNKMDVFIGIFNDNDIKNLEISHETLALTSRLSLNLDCSFY